MTAVKRSLADGVKVGKTVEKDVELGELTAGQLLDAERAAEEVKLVTVGGRSEAVVVSSPALFAWEKLRRRIKQLGSLKGPIESTVLRGLSERDQDTLLAAADEAAALALKGAGVEGRSDQRQGGD